MIQVDSESLVIERLHADVEEAFRQSEHEFKRVPSGEAQGKKTEMHMASRDDKEGELTMHAQIDSLR